MSVDPTDVECPTCCALPGKRCIQLRTRNRKRPLTQPEPHALRRWPTRRCPKCRVLPGEACRTPTDRVQPTPHTARLRPTREEIAGRQTETAAAGPQGPAGLRVGGRAAIASGAAGREREADEARRTRAADVSVDVDGVRGPSQGALTGRDGDVSPTPPRPLPGRAALDQALPGEVAEVLDAMPAATPNGPVSDFGSPAPIGGELVNVAQLAELGRSMLDYANQAQAPNTTRAYASDWRAFTQWADERGLRSMPADPATCALYLAAIVQTGLKLATVRRRAAAITRAHRRAHHPTPLSDPGVKSVLEGIARTHGTPARKKAALDRDQLLAVTAAIDPTTTAGLRDRALLLVGFALGLRRSELVALQVEDLKPHRDGLLVTLNRAKGDQHGQGHTFLLARGQTADACPVTALHAWITHAQLTHGPIARRVSRGGRVLNPLTAQSIPLIVRRRLEAADLPGVSLDDYAGHSLRSGFATQAARDGYTPTQIRHVTRHKDARSLDGYIQAGTGAKDLARVL